MEDMNENKGSALVVGLVAAVVGLLVGFGGATVLKSGKSEEINTPTPVASTQAPDSDTKAAGLRVVLNALEREHVNLAAAATRAGFDGRADFAAAAGQLDINSKAIAAAVGSVYGADAEKKFYDIWASHITFFVNYTVAAKKADKPGMDKAVADLNGYVEAISTFLSTANPNLPKQAVADLVTEHVGLLKGAVDNHGAKKYPESYAKEHEANEQIGKIADALAGAIVKQMPDKF